MKYLNHKIKHIKKMKNIHNINKMSGFSLIELMVGMTIGLLVLGVIIVIFLTTKSTFQSSNGVATITDNGRFAMGLIEKEARGAGYLGCDSSARADSILSLTGSDTVNLNFIQPITGFEANGTSSGSTFEIVTPAVADSSSSDWSPTLSGSLVGQPVKGSDIIVFYEKESSSVPQNVTGIVDGADNMTLLGTTGLSVGQIAAISDCAKSTAFQITKISGTSVFHDQQASPSPGNVQSAFIQSYGIGAVVSTLDTEAFYIGVGLDGDSALFEGKLSAGADGGYSILTPTEIAADVENMQVLYGLDTVGNQTTTEYVTANNVTTFNSVVSIKIALLMASPSNMTATNLPSTNPTYNLNGTTITAPLDNKLRRVFETTIGLRDFLP